eukprot:jgi/Chrzof1/5855/Cz16g18080.t1
MLLMNAGGAFVNKESSYAGDTSTSSSSVDTTNASGGGLNTSPGGDDDAHPADPYAQEGVPPPRPDDYHEDGDSEPPSASFPA